MKVLSKLLSYFFIIILYNFSYGQTASVKFDVKVPKEGLSKNASIFLMGSFNCWNPHDSLYIMQDKGNDFYSLVVPLFAEKKYEYKYTQGNWETVEMGKDGKGIKNRQMISKDGLTIIDTVLSWGLPHAEKKMDSVLMFSPEQLMKLSKLKEEMGKQMGNRAKNFMSTFKKAIQNMLSDKPDLKLREKYHKEMVAEINKALDMAADAIWKASSILTPEQKNAIKLKFNNHKSSGDIFRLIFNALRIPKK